MSLYPLIDEQEQPIFTEWLLDSRHCAEFTKVNKIEWALPYEAYNLVRNIYLKHTTEMNSSANPGIPGLVKCREEEVRGAIHAQNWGICPPGGGLGNVSWKQWHLHKKLKKKWESTRAKEEHSLRRPWGNRHIICGYSRGDQPADVALMLILNIPLQQFTTFRKYWHRLTIQQYKMANSWES